MPQGKHSKNTDELHPTLVEAYLGVWRVVHTRGSTFSIPGKHTIQTCKRAYEYIRMYIIPFILDIRSVIGTKLFTLYLLHHLWWGIDDALLLYLLSGLLKEIEATYLSGKADKWTLGSALSVRLLCVVLVAFINWFYQWFAPILRTRTRLHFQKITMETHLRLDLSTYSDAANRPNAQASDTWYVFADIMKVVNIGVSVLSHMALIADLARGEHGGLLFAFLCIAKPVFKSSFTRDLWSTNFIAYSVDPNYLRSVSLNSLATDKKYKQEVLSGTLETYIQDEFQKTKMALGEKPLEFPTR